MSAVKAPPHIFRDKNQVMHSTNTLEVFKVFKMRMLSRAYVLLLLLTLMFSIFPLTNQAFATEEYTLPRYTRYTQTGFQMYTSELGWSISFPQGWVISHHLTPEMLGENAESITLEPENIEEYAGKSELLEQGIFGLWLDVNVEILPYSLVERHRNLSVREFFEAMGMTRQAEGLPEGYKLVSIEEAEINGIPAVKHTWLDQPPTEPGVVTIGVKVMDVWLKKDTFAAVITCRATSPEFFDYYLLLFDQIVSSFRAPSTLIPAPTTPPTTPPQTPSPTVTSTSTYPLTAIVTSTRGQVNVQEEDILYGGEVITGKDGYVELLLEDGSIIELGPNSRLKLEIDLGEIELDRGLIKIKSDSPYKIYTPVSLIGVRGTEFTLEVEPNGTTTVIVLEGAVNFSDINLAKTVVVGEYQTSTVHPGGLPSDPSPIEPSQIDGWWEEISAEAVKTPTPISTPEITPPMQFATTPGKFVKMFPEFSAKWTVSNLGPDDWYTTEPVEYSHKVVGEEVVEGVACWRVQVRAPTEPGKPPTEATYWFSKETGECVQAMVDGEMFRGFNAEGKALKHFGLILLCFTHQEKVYIPFAELAHAYAPGFTHTGTERITYGPTTLTVEKYKVSLPPGEMTSPPEYIEFWIAPIDGENVFVMEYVYFSPAKWGKYELLSVALTPAPTPTPAPITSTPAPTPKITPTPTPTPGFEAILAIAGLLAVAYIILNKMRR